MSAIEEKRNRRRRVRLIAGVAGAAAMCGLSLSPAQAVHFYRGPAGGCTAADGARTDDTSGSGPAGATVSVLHNTFNDKTTSLPETHIKAGESVVWEWASSHCHSVKADAFYSGYHYPTAAPESPAVAPGVFHYPVPDGTPTLSYRHTFTTSGTYAYFCEHHAAIGMSGTIVVEP